MNRLYRRSLRQKQFNKLFSLRRFYLILVHKIIKSKAQYLILLLAAIFNTDQPKSKSLIQRSHYQLIGNRQNIVKDAPKNKTEASPPWTHPCIISGILISPLCFCSGCLCQWVTIERILGTVNVLAWGGKTNHLCSISWEIKRLLIVFPKSITS